MLHSAYPIHTQTHTCNGLFSETTRVSRYQKGKNNLDFTEASVGPYESVHLAPDRWPRQHPTTQIKGQRPFLPLNQQHQSTEGKTFSYNYYAYIPMKTTPCIISFPVSSLLVITYEVMDMVCRLVLLNLNFIKKFINRVLFSECY